MAVRITLTSESEAGGSGRPLHRRRRSQRRLPARDKGQKIKTDNFNHLKLGCSHSRLVWLLSAIVALLSCPILAQSIPLAVEKPLVSEFEKQSDETLPWINFLATRNPFSPAAGKTLFFAVAACSSDGRLLAMRMTPLQGFRSDSVDRWARQHLSWEAEVTSDGLPRFRPILETWPHWSIDTGGGQSSVEKQEFFSINTMLGNVKNAIHGAYHAIAGKYLGRYLGAFAYRFNHQFELETGWSNGSPM